MIDNLEIIKPLLNFKKNHFFMLYIFQRKKDQEVKENHQSVRTIKSYCIDSLEYLEKRYDEIQKLCELFNARAYIHICSQSHEDIGLDMISKISERIKQKQYNQKHVFDSVVGSIATKEKYWIVDVDNNDETFKKELVEHINYKCRPSGLKIIATVPTKNGYHLITERFDVQEFKKKYPLIDIQKKNPTLLYYPNSLP